jgi:hypothetical protein
MATTFHGSIERQKAEANHGILAIEREASWSAAVLCRFSKEHSEIALFDDNRPV